jgi:hypothetical protein
MVWDSFDRRLDALEERLPPAPKPVRHDASRWSDAEAIEMGQFTERIVVAGVAPEQAPSIFSPNERERIAELLAKVELG